MWRDRRGYNLKQEVGKMFRKSLMVLMFGMFMAGGTGPGVLAWEIPLEWLVARSDAIVTGEVITEKVIQDGKNFYTIYTVTVDRTLLGDRTKTVQFRLFGGELPGQGGCWYSHRPVIKKGENIVIMLRNHSDQPVVGDDQGKFTISADNRIRETGEELTDFLDRIQEISLRVRS